MLPRLHEGHRRSDEEVEIHARADHLRAATGESGQPVVDVCRQIGVSEATFYTWKKKYADLGVSELRRLKQIEDENARLRDEFLNVHEFVTLHDAVRN